MIRLLLALGLLLAVPPVKAQDAEFKRLTPDELKEMFDKKASFLFLDVRQPDELERLGTLPGYVNIPLGELADRWQEIPRNQTIVSACNRAHRAATAASLLRKNGYVNILLFAMNDWREKGYEVVYPKAPGKK